MKFTWSSWDYSVSLCLEPSLDPSPLQRFVLLFTGNEMCIAVHSFYNNRKIFAFTFLLLFKYVYYEVSLFHELYFTKLQVHLLFSLLVVVVDFQCHSNSLAQPWCHWLLSPCTEITPGVLEEPAGWRGACGHQPASPPTHSILSTRHESFLPASVCQGIIEEEI